jgi:hypothetical protein
LDPHIKEIIESQMPQEEKDALASLDPSLENKTIIRIHDGLMYPYIPGSTKESFYRKIGSYTFDPNTDIKSKDAKCYYVFADKPYEIALFDNEIYVTGLSLPFTRDIANLPAEVEVNGKLSPITGIYCYQWYEQHNTTTTTVCIRTESGAIFKYYISGGSCKATYSETDYLKYGAEYYKYGIAKGKEVYKHRFRADHHPLRRQRIGQDHPSQHHRGNPPSHTAVGVQFQPAVFGFRASLPCGYQTSPTRQSNSHQR